MFRDYFLYRATPVAAFKACFCVRKELKKKKVNGEIFFALISLLHVQEPCKHVTYYESIWFSCKIYYHKIFETKSWWPLFFVCMDEVALLRSINVISKGNGVTPCNGEVLYVLLSGSCFYCLNLKTVVPEIRDKEICQTHVNKKLWCQFLLRQGTQ